MIDVSDILLLIENTESNRFTDLIKASGIDPTIDLAGLNLGPIYIDVGESVEGYNFDNSILDFANFAGAELVGASFKGASLRKANLEGAKFNIDQFTKEQLSHMYLDRPTWDSIFSNIKLRGVLLDEMRSPYTSISHRLRERSISVREPRRSKVVTENRIHRLNDMLKGLSSSSRIDEIVGDFFREDFESTMRSILLKSLEENIRNVGKIYSKSDSQIIDDITHIMHVGLAKILSTDDVSAFYNTPSLKFLNIRSPLILLYDSKSVNPDIDTIEKKLSSLSDDIYSNRIISRKKAVSMKNWILYCTILDHSEFD